MRFRKWRDSGSGREGGVKREGRPEEGGKSGSCLIRIPKRDLFIKSEKARQGSNQGSQSGEKVPSGIVCKDKVTTVVEIGL